jgi:hypothetical protein
MTLRLLTLASLSLAGITLAQDLSTSVNGNALNPLRVALKRWYTANGTGASVTLGSPTALAFDGVNLWAADTSRGRLLRVRPSDGRCYNPSPLEPDHSSLTG